MTKKRQTPKQIALLIMIGACVWVVVIVLMLGVFGGVSEALRIQAGEGESWRYAIGTVLLQPIVIAVFVCTILRLWKEYNEPD